MTPSVWPAPALIFLFSAATATTRFLRRWPTSAGFYGDAGNDWLGIGGGAASFMNTLDGGDGDDFIFGGFRAHDVDRVADHVGRALLAFGASRQCLSERIEIVFRRAPSFQMRKPSASWGRIAVVAHAFGSQAPSCNVKRCAG
jgi:hypothetical protein